MELLFLYLSSLQFCRKKVVVFGFFSIINVVFLAIYIRCILKDF
jgi:hypothetical protein